MQRKILPTITTTDDSDWRKKLNEIKKLKLEEVAVFPTCLDRKERSELYGLLKETKVKRAPLFHLRDDILSEEVEYFIKNYQTKMFCIHSSREYCFPTDIEKYKKMVFIENTRTPLDEKEIKEFAGVCLDFSHLEDDRRMRPENFAINKKIIEKYPVGCGHISAIKKEKKDDRYSSHFFQELSEFDYLKKYPKKYFPKILAIELVNSIGEQLKVKDYLKNILKN